MKHFDLGPKYLTPGVVASIRESPIFCREVNHALERHEESDFGDMSTEDIFANLSAVARGDRVFSAYDTSKGRLWIITEADRSHTTILFPSEY